MAATKIPVEILEEEGVANVDHNKCRSISNKGNRFMVIARKDGGLSLYQNGHKDEWKKIYARSQKGSILWF